MKLVRPESFYTFWSWPSLKVIP